MSARPFLGQLRQRLTILSPVDAPDDNGGVSRTYVEGGDFYAQIRPIGARARLAGAQPEAIVTHHILFRERSDLTSDTRLTKGARVFRVIAVERFDDLSNFVRAVCEEVRP